MTAIRTKSDFLDRAARGLMGNQMSSWGSVSDARASGYDGPVMVRYKAPDSPFMRPNVPMAEVGSVVAEFVAAGARRDLLYLTHMTAEVGRRINAEVWAAPDGLYLNYSTEQTHLRAGLDRSGRHVCGAAALAVLRWACCPNSFDDLMALLELYPDHAIELTAYDREIGTIPGRNTVIWEVRSY